MSRASLAARVRLPAERTIRVRHRMLQTPVVRFEHAKTGRTVTVAGVVHIARAGYYRQLGVMLTNLEAAGALILYEGVGHAAETGWSAVGQADRDTWNSVQTGGKELTQAACRYLGWVRQGEALAMAGAGLLFADAWFDVCTSAAGTARLLAIGEALVVELPLAAAAIWLAVSLTRSKSR